MYNGLWSSEKGYCLYWKAFAPDFKAPSYFLARGYEDEGNFTAARKLYQESLLNRYKDWLVYASMGECSLREGKIEQAVMDFKSALKLEPWAGEAFMGLGVAYTRQKAFAAAEKMFNKALAVDRFALAPRFNLAVLAQAGNRIPQAARIYRQILTLDPGNSAAQGALMRIYLAGKDRRQTIAMALEILRRGNDPVNLTMAGSALSYYQMPQPAESALRKAIQRGPRFKDAYVEAQKFYVKYHDREHAAAMARAIKELGRNGNPGQY